MSVGEEGRREGGGGKEKKGKRGRGEGGDEPKQEHGMQDVEQEGGEEDCSETKEGEGQERGRAKRKGRRGSRLTHAAIEDRKEDLIGSELSRPAVQELDGSEAGSARRARGVGSASRRARRKKRERRDQTDRTKMSRVDPASPPMRIRACRSSLGERAVSALAKEENPLPRGTRVSRDRRRRLRRRLEIKENGSQRATGRSRSCERGSRSQVE